MLELEATDVPESEEIARRAYGIWQAEGHPDGCALDHWLRAEAEMKALDGQEGTPDLPTQDTGPAGERSSSSDE
jgi:hypothetical protein